MSESRIIDLETKITHHKLAIEELQKVTHEQYLMIDKLEKSLAVLIERYKAVSANENPIGPANEKPPHY